MNSPFDNINNNNQNINITDNIMRELDDEKQNRNCNLPIKKTKNLISNDMFQKIKQKLKEDYSLLNSCCTDE